MPSDSIAELPVNAAATNFETAMQTFPVIAAKIALVEDLPGTSKKSAPLARPRQASRRVASTKRNVCASAERKIDKARSFHRSRGEHVRRLRCTIEYASKSERYFCNPRSSGTLARILLDS